MSIETLQRTRSRRRLLRRGYLLPRPGLTGPARSIEAALSPLWWGTSWPLFLFEGQFSVFSAPAFLGSGVSRLRRFSAPAAPELVFLAALATIIM